MRDFIELLDTIEDTRQDWKVKHKLSDIIGITLFSVLGYADTWEDIEAFAKHYESFLKQYFELKNGIPSHDTIRRVIGMLNKDYLNSLIQQWHELINTDEGDKLKKILNIDGKAICGNGNKNQKAIHVVSAWLKEDGICLGQEAVEEKENEITVIPELLDKLNIKGNIVTIDAMGTQKKIAEKIVSKKADYVLALKANHEIFHNEVIDYFDDFVKKQIRKSGNGYLRDVQKAHGQIELREYYQTTDVNWFCDKKEWAKLKSIGMVEKTVKNEKGSKTECRYYISSLPLDIELFSRSIREHWAIESMHWHLDVTFKEDANKTLDKNAALNMNIIRKFCLKILKMVDFGKKITALRRKRFVICMDAPKYFELIFAI